MLKFSEQQEADAFKRQILESRGVQMLYPTHKLKPHEFETFIKNRLPMMVS